jgi:hypothetical protein
MQSNETIALPEHNEASKISIPVLFIVIASLALLNNLKHSTVVYHSISGNEFEDWFDQIYDISVNIVVDLSVFAFVLKGRHIEAGVYAFFILMINILYYSQICQWMDELTAKRIAAIVYSLMFTYSIFIFSYLISIKLKGNDLMQKLNALLHEFKAKLLEAEASIKLLNEKLMKLSSEKASIEASYNQVQAELKDLRLFKENRLKDLTCECGFVAPNDYGLSGHRKGCKQAKLSINAEPEFVNA